MALILGALILGALILGALILGASWGSLIMVVEAIKIYNCLFYVGTQ